MTIYLGQEPNTLQHKADRSPGGLEIIHKCFIFLKLRTVLARYFGYNVILTP